MTANTATMQGGLHAEHRVTSIPKAVGEVRTWAEAMLHEWELDPAVVDDMLLLVSEAVTNSVKNARSEVDEIIVRIEVLIEEERPVLRGEVLDHTPGQVHERRTESNPGLRDEPGGWGLFLVRSLARSFAALTLPGEGGHLVYFDLDPKKPRRDFDEVVAG